MAARIRTEHERDRDLALLSELYAAGHTQREIAERLGLTQQQVSYDLKILHERWRKASVAKIEELKLQELARLDNLESLAMDAWHRSCENAETTETSTVKGRTARDGSDLPDLERTRRTAKGQSGDPRFLGQADRCVELRCKILGIFKDQLDVNLNGQPVKVLIDVDTDRV